MKSWIDSSVVYWFVCLFVRSNLLVIGHEVAGAVAKWLGGGWCDVVGLYAHLKVLGEIKVAVTQTADKQSNQRTHTHTQTQSGR